MNIKHLHICVNSISCIDGCSGPQSEQKTLVVMGIRMGKQIWMKMDSG